MRIIIVDQRADDIAAQLLQTDKDLIVEGLFTDGDQGIEAICSLLPDMAIVDIDMANVTQLAALRQQDQPFTEFVLLSEWATFAYEAFRFGAADFLLKPFEHGELQKSFVRVSKKVQDKLLIKELLQRLRKE